jgi:hypothetical protein
MLLSRNDIIIRALRKMGSYMISMSSPREGEPEEAAYWLDMVIGHQAMRWRNWGMVEETKSFPLVAGTNRYDLASELGNDARRGFQYLIGAYLFDVETNRDVCELVQFRREEYEGKDNKDDPANLSQPWGIYINRMNSPIAFLYPTPSDLRSWRVRLVFQTFPEDMVAAAPNSRALGLRQSWNLWIVTALAAELADGPIRKLPQDEVRSMRKDAEKLRNELEGEDYKQQADETRQISFYNGV